MWWESNGITNLIALASLVGSGVAVGIAEAARRATAFQRVWDVQWVSVDQGDGHMVSGAQIFNLTRFAAIGVDVRLKGDSGFAGNTFARVDPGASIEVPVSPGDSVLFVDWKRSRWGRTYRYWNRPGVIKRLEHAVRAFRWLT